MSLNFDSSQRMTFPQNEFNDFPSTKMIFFASKFNP